MEWLTSHLADLIQIITSIIAAASVIANFTTTDVDNKIVAFLSKLVNMMALNIKVGPVKKND